MKRNILIAVVVLASFIAFAQQRESKNKPLPPREPVIKMKDIPPPPPPPPPPKAGRIKDIPPPPPPKETEPD